MYAALGWTLIALAALMIPKDFWGADVIVVVVLALAAVWYFAALRGRLARGEAGVTPLGAPPAVGPPAAEPVAGRT
jgi:hypothetical protein